MTHISPKMTPPVLAVNQTSDKRKFPHYRDRHKRSANLHYCWKPFLFLICSLTVGSFHRMVSDRSQTDMQRLTPVSNKCHFLLFLPIPLPVCNNLLSNQQNTHFNPILLLVRSPIEAWKSSSTVAPRSILQWITITTKVWSLTISLNSILSSLYHTRWPPLAWRWLCQMAPPGAKLASIFRINEHSCGHFQF